jgi:hypothetical protein
MIIAWWKSLQEIQNKYKQTTSVVDFQTDCIAASQDIEGFICV